MLRRALLTLAILLISLAAQDQKQRHFVFHYSFKINNVPARQRLRVWIPLAHCNPYQQVRVISKSGDLRLKATREAEYGNLLLYAESAKAKKSRYQFPFIMT